MSSLALVVGLQTNKWEDIKDIGGSANWGPGCELPGRRRFQYSWLVFGPLVLRTTTDSLPVSVPSFVSSHSTGPAPQHEDIDDSSCAFPSLETCSSM